MQKDCEQLKKDIICRVNRIYVWRTYTRPVVVESVVLTSLIGGALCMASGHHIIANAHANNTVGGFMRFIISMFANTEFSMKALSLAVGVIALLIVRDMFAGFSLFTRKIRSVFS